MLKIWGHTEGVIREREKHEENKSTKAMEEQDSRKEACSIVLKAQEWRDWSNGSVTWQGRDHLSGVPGTKARLERDWVGMEGEEL